MRAQCLDLNQLQTAGRWLGQYYICPEDWFPSKPKQELEDGGAWEAPRN